MTLFVRCVSTGQQGVKTSKCTDPLNSTEMDAKINLNVREIGQLVQYDWNVYIYIYIGSVRPCGLFIVMLCVISSNKSNVTYIRKRKAELYTIMNLRFIWLNIDDKIFMSPNFMLIELHKFFKKKVLITWIFIRISVYRMWFTRWSSERATKCKILHFAGWMHTFN